MEGYRRLVSLGSNQLLLGPIHMGGAMNGAASFIHTRQLANRRVNGPETN